MEKAPLRISVLHEGKLIGIVRDMSEERMNIATPRTFEVGRQYEFGLSLPGALRAVTIKGFVMNDTPAEGIDVAFIDLAPEALESLKDVLNKIREARAVPKNTTRKNKILLVEDSDQIRHVYKGRLLLDGYEVADVSSAMDAVKYLREELPDLILLDLIMPIMDGFKLLKMIRETSNLSHLPVIILSAKGASEEIEKALQLGISGYLIKTTTSPVKLSQEIKEYFRKNG
ncbi:MAG: response regulator [Nitrospirota bacterium]